MVRDLLIKNGALANKKSGLLFANSAAKNGKSKKQIKILGLFIFFYLNLGNEKLIDILISNGIDLNAKHIDVPSPLLYAALNGK